MSLVKAFGNAKIVERCLDTVSKTQFVLVQTSTDLTEQTLPDCVGLLEEAGPWPAHVLPALEKDDDFAAKLLSYLRHEGKTVTRGKTTGAS